MSLTKVSYSMINGAQTNVLDYGAVGDGVTDDTDAIFAAINATAGLISAGSTISGGTVYFPTGQYLVRPDVLNLADMQCLVLQGDGDNYSVERKFGTKLIAKSAGTYLIEIGYTSTNIEIRDMGLDGMNLVDHVLSVKSLAGDTTTYNRLKGLTFDNCKDDQSFIYTSTPSAIFSESSIWLLQDCTFTLNSGNSPSAKGTAVVFENSGSWGWRFYDCNFAGQSKLQTIRLYAGNVYFENCEFDNNNLAGTNDIRMWGSSSLHMNNCNIQSLQPMLYVVPADIVSTWNNFPILITDCTQYNPSNPSLPAISIVHTTTNPISISNHKCNGISITGVPLYISIENCPFVYLTNRTATQMMGQKSGLASDARASISNDLNHLMTERFDPSLLSWVLTCYDQQNLAYEDLYLAAKTLTLGAGTPGALRMFNVTTPDAPGAPGGSLFVKDNGSGKSQLCVRFATGAVQVIATEP